MTNWPQALDTEITRYRDATGIGPDTLILSTTLTTAAAYDTARAFPGVTVGADTLLTYRGILLAFQPETPGTPLPDIRGDRRGVRIVGHWDGDTPTEMTRTPLRGNLPTRRLDGLCLSSAQALPRALDMGAVKRFNAHEPTLYWTPDRSHHYGFQGLAFTSRHHPAVDTLIQKGVEITLAREYPGFNLTVGTSRTGDLRTWDVTLYDNVGNTIVRAVHQPGPGVGLLNALTAIKGE